MSHGEAEKRGLELLNTSRVLEPAQEVLRGAGPGLRCLFRSVDSVGFQARLLSWLDASE